MTDFVEIDRTDPINLHHIVLLLLINCNQVCILRHHIVTFSHLLLFQKWLHFFRNSVSIKYQVVKVLVDLPQNRLFLIVGQLFSLLTFLFLSTVTIFLNNSIDVKWQLLLVVFVQFHSELDQISIDILDIVVLDVEFF